MRRIKNYDNLTKDDLLISLLKSESNSLERNYMRYFNHSTSDNTYDDKIKGKTNDIRIILSRLNTLNKKEEYQHSDHDDLGYFGIRELENLFSGIDNDDNYCKPVLVKTSFKSGCKYYESRGDRDKFIGKTISLHDYDIF